MRRVVETDLPTEYGEFRTIIYENVINGETHLALVMGDISGTTEPTLVRVQTENVTFAMFGTRLGEAARAIPLLSPTNCDRRQRHYSLPASTRQ